MEDRRTASDEAALEIEEIGVERLDELEPLWLALHSHHEHVTPRLGPLETRSHEQSWLRRRAKYEHWLSGEDCFVLVARSNGAAAGYAVVTIGPGHANWASGDRIAELRTLAVAAPERGRGVGSALLAGVRQRLEQRGVTELAVTATTTNHDSHRFYERHGMTPVLRVMLGRVTDL